MNRDDIIRMAQESDFPAANYAALVPDGDWAALERFAKLVAAAEREACATFLERGVDMAGLAGSPEWAAYTAHLLLGCAEAIRARGNDG